MKYLIVIILCWNINSSISAQYYFLAVADNHRKLQERDIKSIKVYDAENKLVRQIKYNKDKLVVDSIIGRDIENGDIHHHVFDFEYDANKNLISQTEKIYYGDYTLSRMFLRRCYHMDNDSLKNYFIDKGYWVTKTTFLYSNSINKLKESYTSKMVYKDDINGIDMLDTITQLFYLNSIFTKIDKNGFLSRNLDSLIQKKENQGKNLVISEIGNNRVYTFVDNLDSIANPTEKYFFDNKGRLKKYLSSNIYHKIIYTDNVYSDNSNRLKRFEGHRLHNNVDFLEYTYDYSHFDSGELMSIFFKEPSQGEEATIFFNKLGQVIKTKATAGIYHEDLYNSGYKLGISEFEYYENGLLNKIVNYTPIEYMEIIVDDKIKKVELNELNKTELNFTYEFY